MSSPETRLSTSEHLGTFVDQHDRFEVYLTPEDDILIECYVGTGVSAQMIPFTYDELDTKLQSYVDNLVLKTK